MRTHRFVLALLVSFSVLLAACIEESPDVAAQEWFNAALETRGADLLALTCEAQKQAVKEFGQGATLLKLGIDAILGMFGVSIPVHVNASEVAFTTVWSDWQRAEVRVEGQIYASVMGFTQEIPLYETWLMVREGGRWKWCGGRADVRMTR